MYLLQIVTSKVISPHKRVRGLFYSKGEHGSNLTAVIILTNSATSHCRRKHIIISDRAATNTKLGWQVQSTKESIKRGNSNVPTCSDQTVIVIETAKKKRADKLSRRTKFLKQNLPIPHWRCTLMTNWRTMSIENRY